MSNWDSDLPEWWTTAVAAAAAAAARPAHTCSSSWSSPPWSFSRRREQPPSPKPPTSRGATLKVREELRRRAEEGGSPQAHPGRRVGGARLWCWRGDSTFEHLRVSERLFYKERGGGRGGRGWERGAAGGGSCQTFQEQLFLSATSSYGDPWWPISASASAVFNSLEIIVSTQVKKKKKRIHCQGFLFFSLFLCPNSLKIVIKSYLPLCPLTQNITTKLN